VAGNFFKNNCSDAKMLPAVLPNNIYRVSIIKKAIQGYWRLVILKRLRLIFKPVTFYLKEISNSAFWNCICRRSVFVDNVIHRAYDWMVDKFRYNSSPSFLLTRAVVVSHVRCFSLSLSFFLSSSLSSLSSSHSLSCSPLLCVFSLLAMGSIGNTWIEIRTQTHIHTHIIIISQPRSDVVQRVLSARDQGNDGNEKKAEAASFMQDPNIQKHLPQAFKIIIGFSLPHSLSCSPSFSLKKSTCRKAWESLAVSAL